MIDVFPALEARFRTSRELSRLGHKLLEGGDGAQVIANRHWSVTAEAVNNDRDTYTTREPTYDLVFELFSTSKTPDKPRQAMRAFRDIFHHADVESAAFDTVLCLVTNERGPFLRTDTGTYGAEMRVSLWIQRRTGIPSIEGT